MALIDKSSIVVPKGFYGKANVLQGFNPQTENLVDLDVVRNTTATRVNEQGLIENVAANVPRRDFLNGGCGELLVEPQRTNLVTYSEEFDNPVWDISSLTITTNQTTSPNGQVTSARITSNSGTSFPSVRQQVSGTENTIYTLSAFIKPDTATNWRVTCEKKDGTSVAGAVFNSVNQQVSFTDEIISFSFIPYANGFFRCSITFNSGTGTSPLKPRAVSHSLATIGGDEFTDGRALFLWGAQLEEGSYPSSYIPTTASAVTRNQDVISATNIGSLLNDAEGGVFFEFSSLSLTSSYPISLSDGTNDNQISIFTRNGGDLRLFSTVGGVTQVNIDNVGSYSANVLTKLAFRYAVNDCAFYQDGTLLGTDTNASTYSDGTLTNVYFKDGDGSDFDFYGRIRQLVVFDNAPTDTEMQTLTTP